MARTLITITILSACLLACGSPVDEPPATQWRDLSDVDYGDEAVRHESIRGVPPLFEPVSLCSLANWHDSAGIFEVSKIISTPDVPGTLFIHLELLDSWYGNLPRELRIRIAGGPIGDGISLAPAISMNEGDVAIFFLDYPDEADQEQFFQLSTALQVFHEVEADLFAGAIHFIEDGITALDLEELISDIRSASGGCPVDYNTGLLD